MLKMCGWPVYHTLPVRVQVKKAVALLPWLKDLQEQQLDARQYEHTPLVELHGWSELPRHVPLFESILVFENFPVKVSFGERSMRLRITDIQFDIEVNYPLASWSTANGGADARADLRRGRFDKSYIETMLRPSRRCSAAWSRIPVRCCTSYKS